MTAMKLREQVEKLFGDMKLREQEASKTPEELDDQILIGQVLLEGAKFFDQNL
jgi:hypothetical protein